MIRVTCLGGVGSVTGSSYLIESAVGKKVLVDCGLFQGGRQLEKRNRESWPFNPAELDVVFLTHAHIDHSGRIPKLFKEGFRGRVITSPPTAELCEIMLLDAGHIQEMDAEWQNRKNKRQNKKLIYPLYTQEDAEACLLLLSPVERDQVVKVEPGIKARLRNAGHILGSSILELWIEDDAGQIKIVFSGDLGNKNQLIVKNPHEVFDAQYLFLESTYGDRLHRSTEESKQELLEAIKYSVSQGEKIMIPAFAVERTQEIIYLLAEFHRAGLLPDIPVYLDSPLAIKATRIFRRNKKYYDEEARALVDQGHDPFNLPNLKFTESTEDSIAINKYQNSAIVIAGNGMCTAGRIKHHFKHNLWRKGASLVIVGFQAAGTTGRRIVDGAKSIRVFGEPVAVRAKVYTIGGFSAHADQKDLLGWVSHFRSQPKVFAVHGEKEASESLAQKIREQFGLEVHVPQWKEKLSLRAREATYEKLEPAAKVESQALMLNTIADLEKELKALTERVKATQADDQIAEEELDRLKSIQDEIHSILTSD